MQQDEESAVSNVRFQMQTGYDLFGPLGWRDVVLMPILLPKLFQRNKRNMAVCVTYINRAGQLGPFGPRWAHALRTGAVTRDGDAGYAA